MPPKKSKVNLSTLLNEKVNSVGTDARDKMQPECFIPKNADKKYTYGFCSVCKMAKDHGYWLYGDMKRPVCTECVEKILPSDVATVINKKPVESKCSPQLCIQYRKNGDLKKCQCCGSDTEIKKTHYIRALNENDTWVDVEVCIKCWKSVGILYK